MKLDGKHEKPSQTLCTPKNNKLISVYNIFIDISQDKKNVSKFFTIVC